MAIAREEFSSQAAPELLEIARTEGRHFPAVLEDAMRRYIESRNRRRSAKRSWPTSRPAWSGTGGWDSCRLIREQRIPFRRRGGGDARRPDRRVGRSQGCATWGRWKRRS